MDLKYAQESNEIIATLHAPDIHAILNGTQISEMTRRGIGHVTLTVSSLAEKRFNEQRPIGHPSYVKILSDQVPTVTFSDTSVEVVIPRSLIATNQSVREQINREDISGPHETTFDSNLTIFLPDLDGKSLDDIDNIVDM